MFDGIRCEFIELLTRSFIKFKNILDIYYEGNMYDIQRI